jgi:hypothetical protein
MVKLLKEIEIAADSMPFRTLVFVSAILRGEKVIVVLIE